MDGQRAITNLGTKNPNQAWEMNLEYEKCCLYYILYDKQSNVISGYWLWQASFNRALKLAMPSTSGDFVLY